MTSGTRHSATASGEEVALLREELAEVKELARTLMGTVQEARAQAARVDSVRGALEDVKADVRAASQAMMMGMAQPPVVAAHGGPVPYVEGRREQCGPCDCVSTGCCCFDIKIWQVRATQPQLEPLDLGEVGPLSFPLEVQFYFTIDGLGFMWPGFASYAGLKVHRLPFAKPGPWSDVCRTVGRVCLPKGTIVTKQVEGWARESDEGIERLLLGFKDEVGVASGSITLDCCMQKIYPPQTIVIDLNQLGNGGGQVEVSFYAERVCC
jgi:hypothetical protein